MVIRLATLRLKYNKLISEVKKQIEAALKAVGRGNRKSDLDHRC